MGQLWLSHHKRKKKNQAFGQPQNRYVVISSFGLFHCKRVKLRAKDYGIMWGAIGSMVRNTLGTSRTCWKVHENFHNNTLGTQNTTHLPSPQKKKMFTSLATRIVCSLSFLGAYNCILVWFALIRWGASQAFFLFLFGNEPIWSAHHSKKNETMEAPQNRRFYFEVQNSSPLAHLYI